MNFRIGQRVKKVAHRAGYEALATVPIGAVGTVIDLNGSAWNGADLHIQYDLYSPRYGEKHCAAPYMVAPLTDPGFDAFMSSVLKPVNLDQPEKVRV